MVLVASQDICTPNKPENKSQQILVDDTKLKLSWIRNAQPGTVLEDERRNQVSHEVTHVWQKQSSLKAHEKETCNAESGNKRTGHQREHHHSPAALPAVCVNWLWHRLRNADVRR